MPYRPNFPIPEDIYAEPFCLCIQVPNDPTWKQVVAGLLDELNQWYNWQRDEEKSGKDCAQVWRGLYEQIDWTTMSCCCDNPPAIFKYDVDGNLYRSTDGGATFEPAPGYDPRNYSTQFPPMPGDDGDDKKCLAATGAAALIKQQVGEQLTDDMTRFTLAQLIETWVSTYLQTANPIQALLTIVANQIFALVIAVLRPALTDDVYDTLKCIIYCNMADDASVNEGQWTQIRNEILAQITGIAGIFFEHLIYLLGTTGTTNLIRANGATEGDCSACACADFCGTTWAWPTTALGTPGTIVIDDTLRTVDIEAVLLGGSYYAGYDGVLDCCNLGAEIHFTTTGTKQFFAGWTCGTAITTGDWYDESNVNWNPSGFNTMSPGNFTAIIARCDAPFTLKLLFST